MERRIGRMRRTERMCTIRFKGVIEGITSCIYMVTPIFIDDAVGKKAKMA